MPTTRRSSGRGRGKQATLSFNHRVTKSVPKSTKDLVASKPTRQSPLAKHVSTPDEPVKEGEEKKEEEEEAVEDVEVEEPEPEPELELEPEPVPEKSEAELRAEKITDRQIDQYWRQLERERIAKRVHQEDLSVAEKVLRYWDVSSQYGPCIGINRVKRWKRAERLGLDPPVEVLAVLMKEEAKGAKGVEMAHMDDILSSTAVGTG
ncbi:DNA polymerase delta, subunit 4-domain-containing protein [Xylariaceae sp. FL0662B]|nr:DNA polymerase delta, subunit 4-domain-containing protein [Xylariaceae sp. FL0662B]